MMQLAALISELWRAAQALALLGWLFRLRWLSRWARMLVIGSFALAWALRKAGGIIVWEAL